MKKLLARLRPSDGCPPSSNDSLCSVCKETILACLTRYWPEFQRLNLASFQYGHHESVEQVKAAAAKGCHLCFILSLPIRLIDGEMRFPYASSSPQHRKFIFEVQWDRSTNTFYVQYRGNNTCSGVFPLIFRLYGLHMGEEIPATPAKFGTNWTRAVQWIETCSKTHSACESQRSKTFRPTRLIYISPIRTAAVRLVTTEKLSNSIKYVTLSHRWTDLDNIKLTTFNISDMKQRIRIRDLPPKYQDAIKIARKLACYGVEYIWIDSLCIIQDSKEDWMSESALMGEVYYHSFCNLGATATFGSRGFLTKAHPHALRDPLIQVDSHYITIPEPTGWFHHFEAEELNTRGWVFQERMLAPRTLHFGSHQLVWECNQLFACEKYPSGAEKPDEHRRANLKRAFSDTLLTSKPAKAAVFKIWDEIIRVYSTLELTQRTDKLTALAGVTKFAEDCLGSLSCAGLWKERFEVGLLWHVVHPQTDRHESLCLGPTWSWASTQCSVDPSFFQSSWENVFSLNAPTCINILNVEELNTDKIRFGQDCGLELKIDCNLTNVTFENTAWVRPDHSKALTLILLGPFRVRIFASVYPDEKPLLGPGNTSSFIFMPVIEEAGLLLKPVENCQLKFRRHGILFIPNSQPSDRRLFDSDRCLLEDYGGGSRHTITII